MKKTLILFTVLLFVFTSCSDNFEDFNTDRKHPDVVPGEVLFSNAQKELADYVSNVNVNINIFSLMSQYWTETTYTDEANYDLVNRNISANIYSRVYLRVLKDLNEAKTLIENTEVASIYAKQKSNKLQIIEILSIYAWQHLVDVFGAVPYTQALDINNVYPVYDSGADIYSDLFTRLNTALTNLDNSAESFGSADLYYGGDVSSWIKFGNSLKIKLAIMVADVQDAVAQTAIEAAYNNAFTSNDDNCLMSYLTSSPNYNQLYADLVASGRHDFVPANTIVDEMNTLNDPRRDAYFTLYNGAYIGGIYGYANSYNVYSHISEVIQQPDFPGIMMTYSEICFYLAEAAERGYNVGHNAEYWYDEGITASFDFWGVSDVSTYLTNPDVAYTTAAGTWKQKIGIQSWIANYVCGIVGYNNWRRLDYPVFNLPETVTDYSDIPVRFTFPINEQTLNTENYNAASSMIGGDLISTKVFWDVH
ncbi:MAG: SusD/RagB family nutrient-binding outer membrane lipoprotein [Bacteroidales bacterium]|nr:SusD/RagB family nutrient-binding outer membrane lipoprotein [Bacteroidales bacterium]